MNDDLKSAPQTTHTPHVYPIPMVPGFTPPPTVPTYFVDYGEDVPVRRMPRRRRLTPHARPSLIAHLCVVRDLILVLAILACVITVGAQLALRFGMDRISVGCIVVFVSMVLVGEFCHDLKTHFHHHAALYDNARTDRRDTGRNSE